MRYKRDEQGVWRAVPDEIWGVKRTTIWSIAAPFLLVFAALFAYSMAIHWDEWGHSMAHGFYCGLTEIKR